MKTKTPKETTVTTIDENVRVIDSPEEEEEQRKGAERKLKVRAADKKERFKLLPAAVKKEKRKAGLDENLLSINDTYQAVFEAALELYGVTNIRDLPEDKKAEFFIVVDSASSDNDLSDIEQLDELKTGTLLRYAIKAGKSGLSTGIEAARKNDMGDSAGAAVSRQKSEKRYAGQKQAVRKINDRTMKMDGSVRVNEESDIEQLDEKNVPTSPEKWAQAISQAKSKFDVYPSAYANGWAAKKYKEMGGSWKSMKEEIELDEDEVGYQHRYAVKNGNAVKDNVKTTGEKDQPYHVYADSPEHAVRKHAKMTTPGMKKEDVQLDEGRPSQRHPLEGHAYHEKSNAELVGIAKDAHAAAEAMKSHNTTAENKYRDQANDSATVRHFRKTSGTPDWYKKKYGHMKEGIVTEMDKSQTPPGRDGGQGDAFKKEYAAKIITPKKVVKDGQNLLNKILKPKEKIKEAFRPMDEPNYNNSIEARQKKADDDNKPPFDGPYKKSTGVVTDKSGAKHGGMSVARNLAKQAMKKQSSKMSVKEGLEESRKAEIVKEIMKKGKKKEDNSFQGEPELGSTVVKADN